jgi:hypothetical protein
MLGRTLFAVVCLIIATGLLWPVYPTELAFPASAAARDMLIADTAASACGQCGPAAVIGERPCPPGPPAAAEADKHCFDLTVYLILRPLPAKEQPGDPQLLPPRLRTI